jgi:hypothetical protein
MHCPENNGIFETFQSRFNHDYLRILKSGIFIGTRAEGREDLLDHRPSRPPYSLYIFLPTELATRKTSAVKERSRRRRPRANFSCRISRNS